MPIATRSSSVHVVDGQVLLRLGALAPGEVVLSPREAAQLARALLALPEVASVDGLDGLPAADEEG